MNLTSLTRRNIMQFADGPQIFHRGEDYHASGAIYRLSVSKKGIKAEVHGNYGDYTVEVEDAPEGLEAECNCPYDGYVCKHIVAVLLRYLEGEYEEVEPMDSEVPEALEQALKEMSHQELLDLMLKLADERPDVRRILLANVSISPEIITGQSKQAGKVKALKHEIAEFFNETQYRSEYGYDYHDYEYDEDEEYPQLDSAFEVARTLHPEDQVEVFWHVLTCGNDLFEEYAIGTAQIEEAVGLYAKAVGQLTLTSEQKRPHFDALIGALDWDMCEFGNVAEALKDALDVMCAVPDDHHYLIGQFEESDHPQANDWIAEHYLALGDDENYLRVRGGNLDTEAQYLELAEYWMEKGESGKYVDTLEEWVSLLPGRERETVYYSPYDTGSSIVLQILAAHYGDQGDNENLCRILMTTAEHDGITLDLYRQVETVSTELGTWDELRSRLVEGATRRPETLARIHLYEEDWKAAIRVAGQNTRYENIQVLVADGVKEHDPKQAIRIYEKLVQNYIDMKQRKHYRTAAGYAKEIKSIYTSIVGDTAAWSHYIKDVRTRYSRRSALKDELREL